MFGTLFHHTIDGVARVPAELQDFSLPNVMVYLCELLMVSIVNPHVYDRSMEIQYSGRVIGVISFEAATIACCLAFSGRRFWPILEVDRGV